MVDRIRNWRPQNLIKAVAPRPTNREERRKDVKFYQSPEWRALRLRVLREQPICRKCEREPSRHVHHIKPRKPFPELALVRSNLEGLCIPCHNAEEVR